jgi:hypothetical protein
MALTFDEGQIAASIFDLWQLKQSAVVKWHSTPGKKVFRGIEHALRRLRP